MKNKKILASILLGATIISAATLVGCGSETPTTTETNAPAVTTAAPVTTTASVVETTAATHAPVTEAKALEELSITDEVGGDVWEYQDDNCLIAVSAGYCKTTDIVYDITFSIEVAKNSSEYESFKIDLQNYKDQIKALNDSELFVSFKETEEGLTFASDFDALELADRATRVAMAEEVIGVTANISDTAFHYTELDAELKSLGLE